MKLIIFLPSFILQYHDRLENREWWRFTSLLTSLSLSQFLGSRVGTAKVHTGNVMLKQIRATNSCLLIGWQNRVRWGLINHSHGEPQQNARIPVWEGDAEMDFIHMGMYLSYLADIAKLPASTIKWQFAKLLHACLVIKDHIETSASHPQQGEQTLHFPL
jgi:hypothetical protein